MGAVNSFGERRLTGGGVTRNESMNRAYVGASMISGVCWGAVAYWSGHDAFPRLIWAGASSSPLIRLLSGAAFHPVRRRSFGWQAVMSLGTLFVAVTLFGVALGAWDAMPPQWGQGDLDQRMRGVICQAVIGVWQGIVLSGSLLILWPASLWNHWLVCRWAGDKRGDGLNSRR